VANSLAARGRRPLRAFGWTLRHGTHIRFQLVYVCQVFHGLNMYWFTLIIKKILRRSRGQAYSHSDKAE
jgi:hypothetical protein